MRKTIVACAISLVALLIMCGIGGFVVASAEKRLVPIYSVERSDNYVSISFDAAWGADKTEKILDICDQYNIKVTFFLVSFWMEKFPEMVKEISDRGHEIGTHSKTHPQMSKLSADKINYELKQSSDLITQITGKPVEVFRPPFGDYNNTLLNCATALNLYTIQWSIDSLDWKGLSAREIATRCQKMEAGDIILCHNNSDHIVEALPAIFECAKIKGLQFIPIGDLIYKTDYTIDGTGKQISNK